MCCCSMAAGDVTFKVLYDGPADLTTINAATASGANSAVTNNNKTIVAVATSTNHVMIIQVLIST